MRTYREIFAVREFRVLFLARCVTIASVSLGSLALGATVYDATGSPVLTALAMFGGPLITLVGSATVLGASDSLGPRRAAIQMPLAYAVANAFQVIPGLPWGVRFVLLAVPFVVGSATSGSVMRLVSVMLPADAIVLGRATLNVAVGVMQVVGFAAGGLLLAAFSPSVLFAGSAVAALLTAVVLRFGIEERTPVPTSGGLVARTHRTNRALLGSRVVRPIYLAAWVPNGLVAGCEALFVPYRGASVAGYLFAVTAAGMLLGDVVVGRVLPPALRDRLVGPLRLLLAAPYVGFLLDPSLPLVLVLGFVASAGYSASLPLQDRLVRITDADVRGQVFGLFASGQMVGQAVGAVVGGVIASVIAPVHAIGVLGLASLLVTVSLSPGLRRSARAQRLAA